MTAPAAEQPASPPQEVDVWWGGLSPRALLPAGLLGLLLTALSIGVALVLYGVVGLSGSLPRWLTYEFNALVWAVLLAVGLYRLAGYQYRLTTRRLFCFHGVLYARSPPIDLGRIQSVAVVHSAWQRRFGVGDLLVRVADCNEPVRLTGVRHPEVVATEIEACVRHRRGGGITHSGMRPGGFSATNDTA